jgi:hypothetical protein
MQVQFFSHQLICFQDDYLAGMKRGMQFHLVIMSACLGNTLLVDFMGIPYRASPIESYKRTF